MLNGLHIVITGAVQGMSRTEAERRVRECAGRVGQRVTRRTNLVVSAENPSCLQSMSIKLRTALANGTPLIPWKEFAEVLDGSRPLDVALDSARERSSSFAAHYGIEVKEPRQSHAKTVARRRRSERAEAVASQLDVLANATHARSKIGF